MRLYSARFLAACILLSVLAGCGDKPTRLYVLTADVAKPATASAQGVPIGVGPVTLPKYLDRPQVVTRTASNSLNQADLDQWGGNLADNITRVLATNLANLLQTDRVSLYPWQDVPVDFQVTLEVMKFEQDPDGSTELDTFWRLVATSSGKVLVMRRSRYREAGVPVVTTSSGDAAARSYDALAAAMSRNIEALSRDIASEIRGRKGP